MDIQTFIDNYQETFSGKAELPIAFWYSDTLSGELRKTQGCLFKALPAIRNGEIISMSGESIGCGGGKFYTGFTPMPEHVPNFVSLKERYKQTPEMVLEGIKKIDVQRATKQYIHFARIDRLTSFEDVEGLLFLATPDILSGLVTWAFFLKNTFRKGNNTKANSIPRNICRTGPNTTIGSSTGFINEDITSVANKSR